jgi:hypothetical protein
MIMGISRCGSCGETFLHVDRPMRGIPPYCEHCEERTKGNSSSIPAMPSKDELAALAFLFTIVTGIIVGTCTVISRIASYLYKNREEIAENTKVIAQKAKVIAIDASQKAKVIAVDVGQKTSKACNNFNEKQKKNKMNKK